VATLVSKLPSLRSLMRQGNVPLSSSATNETSTYCASARSRKSPVSPDNAHDADNVRAALPCTVAAFKPSFARPRSCNRTDHHSFAGRNLSFSAERRFDLRKSLSYLSPGNLPHILPRPRLCRTSSIHLPRQWWKQELRKERRHMSMAKVDLLSPPQVLQIAPCSMTMLCRAFGLYGDVAHMRASMLLK